MATRKKDYYLNIWTFSENEKGDYTPTIFGTIYYRNGKIEYDGLSKAMIEEFEELGIPLGGKLYYPKDGYRFLEAASLNIKGTTMSADKIRQRTL